jgi:hypothetical protein
MLVSSSQSSVQRPLGLSLEELYALDHQYRRIEQQQQHLAQLQSQTRSNPSNLNRLNSRSLDLISSSTNPPYPVIPSLEIHGHGFNNRQQTPSSASGINYTRSQSIDQFRYTSSAMPTAVSSSPLKPMYPSRAIINENSHSQYHPRYSSYLQVTLSQ